MHKTRLGLLCFTQHTALMHILGGDTEIRSGRTMRIVQPASFASLPGSTGTGLVCRAASLLREGSYETQTMRR